MSYTSNIFDRANIQQIREFLLHGVECVEIETKPYKEQIDEAQKGAMEILQRKFPDMNEREEITREIYNYVSATEQVYMEIGLQCGAKLLSACQSAKE